MQMPSTSPALKAGSLNFELWNYVYIFLLLFFDFSWALKKINLHDVTHDAAHLRQDPRLILSAPETRFKSVYQAWGGEVVG